MWVCLWYAIAEFFEMEKSVTGQIRTGIFSGSFNPIHIGHLALANWLCEFCELDELWFLISPQNPLKVHAELLNDRLRLELAEQAVASYPKFKVSDFEFSMPKPSYTIDTLRALRKQYPKNDFCFIMGADNWLLIDRWKESQALIREFPIWVYPRKGYVVRIPESCTGVHLVEAPLMEISSTFIRDAFRSGKDVRFFLPESIRERVLSLYKDVLY